MYQFCPIYVTKWGTLHCFYGFGLACVWLFVSPRKCYWIKKCYLIDWLYTSTGGGSWGNPNWDVRPTVWIGAEMSGQFALGGLLDSQRALLECSETLCSETLCVLGTALFSDVCSHTSVAEFGTKMPFSVKTIKCHNSIMQLHVQPSSGNMLSFYLFSWQIFFLCHWCFDNNANLKFSVIKTANAMLKLDNLEHL